MATTVNNSGEGNGALSVLLVVIALGVLALLAWYVFTRTDAAPEQPMNQIEISLPAPVAE